ncbi:hypothetical protein SAMN05660359_04759 [Geodermatophilus obscurus]|uniref:Uncharacterized protein n=1 Tax=Geodermatophilus obscurus TaxID=1861 RepID=A0A1I5IPH3_9ACTN|nr:hypothetical protein [Geodermatophilus obscurus]SFO62229.1 hypothetical protein SAMN05660359_04759 [Geodermatophilus obscurus]
MSPTTIRRLQSALTTVEAELAAAQAKPRTGYRDAYIDQHTARAAALRARLATVGQVAA